MSIQSGFRKAGQVIANNPVPVALVGGGSALGIAGVLQSMSPQDQDAVIGEAIAQENEGGGEVLGMSSASLLAGAAILGVIGMEDDIGGAITPLDLDSTDPYNNIVPRNRRI